MAKLKNKEIEIYKKSQSRYWTERRLAKIHDVSPAAIHYVIVKVRKLLKHTPKKTKQKLAKQVAKIEINTLEELFNAIKGIKKVIKKHKTNRTALMAFATIAKICDNIDRSKQRMELHLYQQNILMQQSNTTEINIVQVEKDIIDHVWKKLCKKCKREIKQKIN